MLARSTMCSWHIWPARRVLELAPAFWKQTLQQQDTQQAPRAVDTRRRLQLEHDVVGVDIAVDHALLVDIREDPGGGDSRGDSRPASSREQNVTAGTPPTSSALSRTMPSCSGVTAWRSGRSHG